MHNLVLLLTVETRDVENLDLSGRLGQPPGEAGADRDRDSSLPEMALSLSNGKLKLWSNLIRI